MTESCYEIMRSARDVNVTVMMGGCVGPAKLPKSTLLEQCAGRVANVTDMTDIFMNKLAGCGKKLLRTCNFVKQAFFGMLCVQNCLI